MVPAFLMLTCLFKKKKGVKSSQYYSWVIFLILNSQCPSQKLKAYLERRRAPISLCWDSGFERTVAKGVLDQHMSNPAESQI